MRNVKTPAVAAAPAAPDRTAWARGAAVVTGGGGGLGTAIARELVALGFHVHLADVDEAAAARAAASVGGGAVALGLDVTDEVACRALAHDLAARPGGLSLWVNNAGLLFTGPAWALPAEQRRRMFDVNVQGTVHGTLAALSVMRPVRAGHVINLVSLAGLVAPPGEGLYAATKHAALGFSLGVLADLRAAGERTVHVSALCPDGIWTPMLFDKLEDPQAAPSWSGVLLTPERVAAAVATVVDRPRPVTSLPRWRGAVARATAAAPRLGLVLFPLVMHRARAKQRAFARTVRKAAADSQDRAG